MEKTVEREKLLWEIHQLNYVYNKMGGRKALKLMPSWSIPYWQNIATQVTNEVENDDTKTDTRAYLKIKRVEDKISTKLVNSIQWLDENGDITEKYILMICETLFETFNGHMPDRITKSKDAISEKKVSGAGVKMKSHSKNMRGAYLDKLYAMAEEYTNQEQKYLTSKGNPNSTFYNAMHRRLKSYAQKNNIKADVPKPQAVRKWLIEWFKKES